MLALPCGDEVHLAAAWGQGAQLAAGAKKYQFGDVPKIKPNAAPVAPAVFADLVPHEVRLVGETPVLEDHEAFSQERIWHPQIAVRTGSHDVGNGQGGDLLGRHRRVASQAPVLRCHLPGPVGEAPGWVYQDRPEGVLGPAAL